MPRMNTLYGFVNNGSYPAADFIGTGNVYPWEIALSTDTGRRQYDIAMAALFRVTIWHVTGDFHISPDVDTLDTTQVATVTGGFFSDERAFAIRGALLPTSPLVLNGRLTIAASGTWADFELPSAGLAPLIKIQDTGDVAAIPFHFTAFPPTLAVLFDSGYDAASRPNESGQVTIRVPKWRGSGWHSLSTTLYSDSTIANADVLIEPIEVLPYEDADGNPVWDVDTGEALLDPVTAAVD